jgi:hypothetical protein
MQRNLLASLVVLIIVAIVPFAFSPFLASCDARRVAQHRSPLFCWSHWLGRDWEILDGGSIIYRGFGYELTAKHKIIGSEPKRYDSGLAIAFSLPFYKRYDSETTVEHTE